MANERTIGAPRGNGRLLIAHSSSDLYGSDLACLRVATAAVHAGWEVEMLLPGDGPLVAAVEACGVTVFLIDPIVLRRADLAGLRVLALPLRWMQLARRLRVFARTRPAYDLVHSNCVPTLGGALIARWSRTAHVWYVHEIFPSRLQRRFFDRLLGESADAVLTCSQHALAQFPRVAAAGIGRVVYEPVEVSPGIEHHEPLRGGVPLIICVARLNSWKGQEVLIAAIAQLRARGVLVRAQLVGSVFRDEQHFEQQLRALVEAHGLGDRVDFLGERRDALELMGTADIAVFASTRPEPFGMALVEAMALGRPVIATEGGGPTEIITDGVNGLLIARQDPAALADALARLIDAPDFARKLGAHALARAADFTTVRTTSEVLATYADVLGRRVA